MSNQTIKQPTMQDPLSSIPFTCYIAGVPHRKPTKLPNLGDIVTLEPEPTNPYDSYAIKVMHDTIHLGYIPKTETARVRQQNLTQLYVIKVQQVKWKEVKLSNILDLSPDSLTPTTLADEVGPASQL